MVEGDAGGGGMENVDEGDILSVGKTRLAGIHCLLVVYDLYPISYVSKQEKVTPRERSRWDCAVLKCLNWFHLFKNHSHLSCKGFMAIIPTQVIIHESVFLFGTF